MNGEFLHMHKEHTMVLLTMVLFVCQAIVMPAEVHADARIAASDIAAVLDPAPVQDPDIFPVAVNNPSPAYPESARRDSVAGTVWVEAVVDPSGRVQDAKIKNGVRSDLDNAATSCMRQWTFRPALEKGRPVRCTIVIPFHFKLKR